jgi:hypothetical protein
LGISPPDVGIFSRRFEANMTFLVKAGDFMGLDIIFRSIIGFFP